MFASGSRLDVNAIFVATVLRQKSLLPAQFVCRLSAEPDWLNVTVETDVFGRPPSPA